MGTKREYVIGQTGARFGGRAERRPKQVDAAPIEPTDAAGQPAAPTEEADLDLGQGSVVEMTGARFARPAHRSRQTRPASPPPTVPPPADSDRPAPAARVAGPAMHPTDPAGFPPPVDFEDTGTDVAAGTNRAVRVRPYVLTGGRTRSRLPLPLEALVTAAPGPSPAHLDGTHRAVVQLCRASQSVAEVAAKLGVPLGVARVLVDDLVAARAVTVYQSRNPDVPDVALIERVLVGLHRL